MRWQGKIIGGILGGLAGFGPIGAALGFVLGHQFDRHTDDDSAGGAASDPQVVSAVFFRSAFAVMGCVAKADGRVSEQEIAAARAVMQQMRLSPDQVQAAIRFFTEGKQSGFALERTIRELREICAGRHDLLRVFMEIQMRAALQGADMQGPARSLVLRIGQMLGLSGLDLAHMEAVLRLQRGPHRTYSRTSGGGGTGDLAQAYKILDVESTAPDEEIVKAYRRQMSRHHPDKLVANGLPESMQELAKEKTQQIREAYETIRARRGMS